MLARARAAVVRVSRELGARLHPGKIMIGDTEFSCSVGPLSFYRAQKPGGGGLQNFMRMNVTIRADHIPAKFAFTSGREVRVRNLQTDQVLQMEIAAGNDMIGRDENMMDTVGNVTLTLVASGQGN